MDVRAEQIDRLRSVQGFVFDMDGTLVLGDKAAKGLRPLPGAVELIAHLRRRGLPFTIMTNGTAHTSQEYITTLREGGLDLPDDVLQTPSNIAADYFRRKKLGRVMVAGIEGVWRPLAEAGLEIVRPAGKHTVDAVFVGWLQTITMDELEAICHAVWQGAGLYTAANTPFFATAQGKRIGAPFAVCTMITRLTRRRPRILGKPSLEALRSASRRLGVAIPDLAVVGDDPGQEVPMAHMGGSLAISVNSGVGQESDFAHLPAERRPHLTLDHVGELLALLR